jgi:hypothetical protein
MEVPLGHGRRSATFTPSKLRPPRTGSFAPTAPRLAKARSPRASERTRFRLPCSCGHRAPSSVLVRCSTSAVGLLARVAAVSKSLGHKVVGLPFSLPNPAAAGDTGRAMFSARRAGLALPRRAPDRQNVRTYGTGTCEHSEFRCPAEAKPSSREYARGAEFGQAACVPGRDVSRC